MAETLTRFDFTCNQGETVYTDWIDVRTATRLRLFIAEKIGGRFTASIDQSTFDPAQNTPIVYYYDEFNCGQTEYGGKVPQSDIFDRKEHLGANYIKIALTNVSSDENFTVFLLTETP